METVPIDKFVTEITKATKAMLIIQGGRENDDVY